MTATERRIEIQKLLGVPADGIFGPKTRQAFEALATLHERNRISGKDWNGLYSPELGMHYELLFNSMTIRDWAVVAVERISRIARLNRERYTEVANKLNIPWVFIAAIHSLEASQNFSAHLHNGDSLTARTRNVPAGRPLAGKPPFTWEESAIDALKMKGFHQEPDWSLPLMLYRLELYNGFGYRKYHSDVPSPYLWSGSSHYKAGKYTSDGQWSDTAVSKQVGGALILRELGLPS